MRGSGKISIVAPVYNNGSSIEELLKRIDAVCSVAGAEYEAIFIDDGSRDNSWNTICRIAQENKSLIGIRLSRNFGQHAAIAAGFEHASGNIIVLMDADLEDRPEAIPSLLNELHNGADVVFTMFGSDTGSSNRLSSRLFHSVISKLAKTQVPKNVGTMRAFNRVFLQAVLQHSEYNIVYGPLIATLGFKQAFVHVPRDTQISESGYTFIKRLRLAIMSLIGFSDFPLLLFSIVGATTMVASMMYALLVVAQYFIFGAQLPGGQTLILLAITLSAGFIVFEIGVVGIYAFNIYREVLRRPRYLIMDSVGSAEMTVRRG